jgi:hypothetical protein
MLKDLPTKFNIVSVNGLHKSQVYILYISLSNKHGFRVGRYGPIAPSDIYCRKFNKFNNLSENFLLGREKENAPVK